MEYSKLWSMSRVYWISEVRISA